MKTGIVYLVGAGPGDPGLITVKGLECLRSAEVIIYDALVHPSILREVDAQSTLIYVGKQAGQHTLPQEEINHLLAEQALAGKAVCRLKGGDPFVFGRGGEEAEYLAERGIKFEVVPGVTSAIAVPAYAGIPVTDRRYASVAAFVTGQEDAERTESTLPWEHLAKLHTLVFLMGMGNLEHITSNLISAGRDRSTPAAVIRSGTTAQQVTVVSVLGDIDEKARLAGLSAPAIIIIGEVVNLREHLRWFDARTLFGLKVLVTRSREQASELSELLIREGAQPVELPTIKIEALPLTESPTAGGPWDWVIFASVNGVKHFFRQLREHGQDARALAGTQLAAIGPATVAALENQGLRADFVPDRFLSEQIVKQFPKPLSAQRILLPRAKIAPDLLPKKLREQGAEVQTLPIYDTVVETNQVERIKDLLTAQQIAVITFTSSSTVRNFYQLIGNVVPSHSVIATIGPVTTAAACECGYRVDIEATEHTIEGLVQAIVAWRERAYLNTDD